MPAQLPSYLIYSVTVMRVRLVTAHMKRITVDVSQLPSVRPRLPAQWLKVFIRTALGEFIGGRAYTVRHFDSASNMLDLDFVLHGDSGPVSDWAAKAQVGDTLEISDVHPRSGYVIHPQTEHYLLLGDETALPAIGAILDALPAHAHAQVVAEVRSASAQQMLSSRAQLAVKWLLGDEPTTEPLQTTAKTLEIATGKTAIWVAAESSQVTAIRRWFLKEQGVDKALLNAAGYWKRGEADHHDQEA